MTVTSLTKFFIGQFSKWPVTGFDFSQVCDLDRKILTISEKHWELFAVTFSDLWSVVSVTCDLEEIWFSQVAL